jgi:hypothetical protein
LQLADIWTSMHVATVPYYNDVTAQMSEQLAQKPGDGFLVKALIDETAEVQAQSLRFRGECQGRQQRSFLSVFGLLEKAGRLATRSQSATDERREQHAAFVQQYQMRG